MRSRASRASTRFGVGRRIGRVCSPLTRIRDRASPSGLRESPTCFEGGRRGTRGVPTEKGKNVERRTRIVLSIPWDDETEDHPSGWGYDVLLNRLDEVHVIDFAEVEVETPAGEVSE